MLFDIASVHISANLGGRGGPACEPKSDDLPAGATAGIECIGDYMIDVGDYYLYPTAEAALATYSAYLADNGVAKGSGDCEAGVPGDSAWWAPAVTQDESPWRIGCFNGTDDEPNVSLVCHAGTPDAPSPVLYVRLVGFQGIEDVYAYALGSPGPRQRPDMCDIFTHEEQRLLDNYSGQGDCSPNRGDLPPDVYDAVECVIGDELVDRVGLYAVEDAPHEGPEPPDLYQQRMADYGIDPLSGDCVAGIPGDSSWIPMDPPSAETFFRIGCFLNENKHANVRLNCPVPNPFDIVPSGHMYVGVLGSTSDIAGLYEWTMGNAEWRDHMAATQRDYPNGPIEEYANPVICTG